MDVIKELYERFITPVIQRFGMELNADSCFRKWTAKRDLCCILHANSENHHYSVTFGFFSPFILKCFGIPERELPTLSMCNLCGILIHVGDASGAKLQMGSTITNEVELAEVGPTLQTELDRHFSSAFNRYMNMNGWIDHFRQMLEKITTSRGLPWSMLGYSLLAREVTTFDEIQEVIKAHSREEPSNKTLNRLEMHLNTQRQIVYERFGKRV